MRSHPPEILEEFGRDFAEISPAVVAGIEDDKVRRVAVGAWQHGPVEEPNDVGLAGHGGWHGLRAAARVGDRSDDLHDFFRRPAGGEHVVSFGRETPAERGAKPASGADTDNDGTRRAHEVAS
jgi:hypothetical protein